MYQNHTKTRNCVSKSHKNEELCIEKDDFADFFNCKNVDQKEIEAGVNEEA